MQMMNQPVVPLPGPPPLPPTKPLAPEGGAKEKKACEERPPAPSQAPPAKDSLPPLPPPPQGSEGPVKVVKEEAQMELLMGSQPKGCPNRIVKSPEKRKPTKIKDEAKEESEVKNLSAKRMPVKKEIKQEKEDQ
jgi:hypothetical protein